MHERLRNAHDILRPTTHRVSEHHEWKYDSKKGLSLKKNRTKQRKVELSPLDRSLVRVRLIVAVIGLLSSDAKPFGRGWGAREVRGGGAGPAMREVSPPPPRSLGQKVGGDDQHRRGEKKALA